MFKAFRNLPPKARAGVGLAIIAWGGAGLYLSDQAEEKFGYVPTDEEKAQLDKYTPKIIPVDNKEGTEAVK